MATGALFIISVYSKLQFLNLVLARVGRQTYKNYDIIIANDGEEMWRFIDQSKQALPYGIKHFRHKASASDYLIIIDGIGIPHKAFSMNDARDGKVEKFDSPLVVEAFSENASRLEDGICNRLLLKNQHKKGAIIYSNKDEKNLNIFR